MKKKMKKMKNRSLGLWLLCCAVTCFSSLSLASQYTVDHRIPLTGGEGWDYLAVDASSSRLFVTRGNHVDVIDLKSEKVIGNIAAPIDGAHGVSFVPGLKKGYITSGASAKVVVFDMDSLKVLKEIPAGKKADAIVFESSTSRIFAFNGLDATITVINAKTDEVLKTLKIDGKPEFAVSDNHGSVYFNNQDKNTLSQIDANTMSIKNTYPLKGCKSPTGLSADFSSRRLFSVCGNAVLSVTDVDTGKNVQTLPIGKGADASVFDAGFAYSSNGSGTLTVVQQKDANHFAVVTNLATQKGARTMAVDPNSHIIYLITAKYETADPKAAKAKPKIIPGSVELLVVKNAE